MSNEEENPEGELYVLSADTYDLDSARSYDSDLLDSATSWTQPPPDAGLRKHCQNWEVQVNTTVLATNTNLVQ
jgi:hypothetical protein